VSRKLHVLVEILGRAEMSGDDPGTMDLLEVADDERVARLGVVRGSFGQAEVPLPELGV
jgi:hypothetical protein